MEEKGGMEEKGTRGGIEPKRWRGKGSTRMVKIERARTHGMDREEYERGVSILWSRVSVSERIIGQPMSNGGACRVE
jgi:hypothetical protein